MTTPAQADDQATSVLRAEQLAAEAEAAAAAAEKAAAEKAAAEKAAAEQAAADKAAADAAAADAAAAEAERLAAVEAAGIGLGTVGAFERVDPVTGGTDRGIGVVVQVAGVLSVVPLAAYWVQVDPADFQPLTAADFEPGS